MLKRFDRNFVICPHELENSDIIINAKHKMGTRLYNMANRVFREYIEKQDKNISGGYFRFAFVVGESGQAPKKDVDYLWNRMVQVYGDSESSYAVIKKVLGTICMIQVGYNNRKWLCSIDPEKRVKVANNEVPDATAYWMV